MTEITQLWTLVEDSGYPGYYRIVSAVRHISRIARNSCCVIYYAGGIYTDQLWKFVEIGLNTYQIVNHDKGLGKLMMSADGSVATSVKDDEINQSWTLFAM